MKIAKKAFSVSLIILTMIAAPAWSQPPTALTDATPAFGTADPGYYSLDQQNAYWSVVGLRSTSDYDLTLFSDTGYTFSLAVSSERGSAVDFIVADHNRAGTGLYYPRVDRFSGTDAYTIEWEDSSDALTPGTPVDVSWGSTSLVKAWDVDMLGGTLYQVSVSVVSGTANVGIALFSSSYTGNYQGLISAIGSADAAGNGQSEIFTYTPGIPDRYGLVVWSDNAASAELSVSVRAAAVPLTDATPAAGTANPGYYSFDQQQSYWSVVGLRSTSDYDLTLYTDPGFYNFVTSSTERGTSVDFIAVDHNRAGTGSYYPKVDRFSGTNSYTIEWEDSSHALSPGAPVDVSWGATSVVKVWDVDLLAGTLYLVSVKVVSGTANVGVALFSSAYYGNYLGRAAAAGSVDAAGNGQSETLAFTPGVSDRYGLVVWSNNAASAELSVSVRAAAEPLTGADPAAGTANPGYYSFDQQQTYWSVVGLRSASDYDLTLYSDPGYSGYLAGSFERGIVVDFLAVDHNRTGTGLYYPKVDRFSGTNAYTIEWEDSPDALTPGVPVDVSWGDSSVVKAWDVELPDGITYQVSVKVVSGTANVGIALVTSNSAYPYYSGNYVSRQSAIGSADAKGAGQSEAFMVTPAIWDRYGVVVWSNNAAGATLIVNVQAPVTQGVPVLAGWNMISLPLEVDDPSKDALFPTSTSNAFAYAPPPAGYISQTNILNGKGYWLKFSAPQDALITGMPITADTITLNQGWNLIGSISYPVRKSAIIQSTGGLITSNYFEYVGPPLGYVPKDTLWPGRGYWVKASTAGSIILDVNNR
ncbi:MAG TPA: hypothetical protein VI932_12130 [Bacteroidota bacterium]|nr:hypothetical protein [Bacteroidota bacterium]